VTLILVGHLDLQILYLREFSKKFKTTLLLFSGAWGKMIHEKNLKKKSRDTVPLNICGRIRRAPVISAASLQRAKERKKLLESKL
jgi:hypothetical protein